MFAPKKPHKKQSLKKQSAHNLEKKLFQDQDVESHHHKQIHKIASVRTIQPNSNKLARDRKSPACYKQGQNLIGKHRRKQSYLGSEGNPESQYESYMKSSPPIINKYYFENSISLNEFYARIEKQLVSILQIIRKQTQEANQKVRKAKQQINQQKIQYFKSLNKSTIDISTQTFIDSSQRTRIRHYTFQQETQDESQEQEITNYEKVQEEEEKKIVERRRRNVYLLGRLKKLGLESKFLLLEGDEKKQENEQIQEEMQIEYNKQLIKMLLLKQ